MTETENVWLQEKQLKPQGADGKKDAEDQGNMAGIKENVRIKK